MQNDLPPTAAKGKFPYPHRDLREVAQDAWFAEKSYHYRLPFFKWLETYHG